MNTKTITEGKAYYHNVVFKTAYMYLPVFSIVVLLVSFFEKLRFILYFTVVGVTYGYILQQLKKKHVIVDFRADDIIIDRTSFNYRDIDSYHLSLPLNDLLMLRLRTKEQKDIAIYVDKNLKESISFYFNNHSIRNVKITYDHYLQYGHAIFLVLYLIICLLIYSLYNYVYYNVLH
ncbi:hypothetical protein [Chryseobacterium sp. GP-SGM7]|uniref:hypothetical protein n=1 Tax=Chryseobacterium sp. GP-SGM7 TaxID=3411323 RepID=UPI003B949415